MPAPAIVVGASSGMGEALARRLVKQGAKVALLARRGEVVERIADELNQECGSELAFAFAHDVSDRKVVDGLWDHIEQKFGKDVGQLYFSSGVLEEVELDEFDTEKDAWHFEVNTLGCIAWVNAAARRFQKKGFGVICGISSVAADRGRIGRPAYCSSKAGMDTYMESIRNRLWRKGVTVTTIRPGFIATPMTEGVEGMFWVISADRAAELILKAVRKRKAIAYVPWKWRMVMFAVRNVPSFVFRKMNF